MSIYTPRVEDTFAFVNDDGQHPHWLVVITPEGSPDEAPALIEVTNAAMETRLYRVDDEQTEKVRMKLRVTLRQHASEKESTQ